MAARYEAVLFDFDGVLADSEPVHFRCWAELLRPLGVSLDWPSYVKFGIGFDDAGLIRNIHDHLAPHVAVERMLAEYPRKQDLVRERMLANPPVPPETVHMLRRLNGFKLAVVTSSTRSEIEPVLVRAGIRDCFGALVFGEDTAQHKPDPAPYLKAAAALEVTSALVVEDSEAGIEAGRRAGFEVLRITDPRRTAEVLSAALGRDFR